MGEFCDADIRIVHVFGSRLMKADDRFLGIFTSLLIPETKRIPLEKLTGESIEVQFEMEAVEDEDGRYDTEDEEEEEV